MLVNDPAGYRHEYVWQTRKEFDSHRPLHDPAKFTLINFNQRCKWGTSERDDQYCVCKAIGRQSDRCERHCDFGDHYGWPHRGSVQRAGLGRRAWARSGRAGEFLDNGFRAGAVDAGQCRSNFRGVDHQRRHNSRQSRLTQRPSPTILRNWKRLATRFIP
jgi:hypothetical protein